MAIAVWQHAVAKGEGEDCRDLLRRDLGLAP